MVRILLSVLLAVTHGSTYGGEDSTVTYSEVSRPVFLQMTEADKSLDESFFQLCRVISPFEFSFISDELLASEAILNILPNKQRIFLALSTKDTTYYFHVNRTNSYLCRQADALYKSYDGNFNTNRGITIRKPDSTLQDNKMVAEDLYNVLLLPVKKYLQGKKHLLISASGTSKNLPFASLGYHDEEQFRFVSEEYTISMLSNKNSVLNAGRKKKPVKKIVVFANPDGTLPGAESEGRAIATQTGAMIFTGEDVTRDAVLKAITESYDVYHFATHGFIDPTDFRKCYLIINDSLYITYQHLYAMANGMAEMMVLSACNTGYANEEISAAASDVMPARTIIASLWPVDDKATEILMKSFYSYINQYGRAEALKKAQAEVRNTAGLQHPYFWAGFYLSGSWR